MQVRLYATLRAIVGARRVDLEGDSATVGDVLRQLIAQHPALADSLLTETGEVRPYVAVIVNGRDVRHTGGLDTPVGADSELDIFPPVAGG